MALILIQAKKTVVHLCTQLVENGHVEVLRELLNHGVNVNTANKDSFTPQFKAGLKGHVEVVRELLYHGAQLDKSDKSGRNFIGLPVEKGYLT